MDLEEARFLERVHKGEDREESMQDRRARRLFIVRNTLNGLFILLALAAMVGIGYYWYSDNTSVRLWSISIGIIAVLLKMVEATMRMSTMLQKPKGSSVHKRKKAL